MILKENSKFYNKHMHARTRAQTHTHKQTHTRTYTVLLCNYVKQTFFVKLGVYIRIHVLAITIMS